MKKTIQLFFALTILALASPTAYGQAPGGGFGGRGGMNMDPEQRAERQATAMRDSLMLSEELTAEVKAVMLVYAKKMQSAREEAGGDWESMRTTMQTMRQEQDEELQAIIGEAQWAKWETIRATMMQRGPRGQGREGAPGQDQDTKKRKKKDTKTDN